MGMQGRFVGSHRSIVRQAERSSAERDCRLFPRSRAARIGGMRTATAFLIVVAVCAAGVAAAANGPASSLFEPGIISDPGNDGGADLQSGWQDDLFQPQYR